MNYWLVKSEPSTYSWGKFIKDGKATWDGVRNYAARNFLRAMKKGDMVLFYHSNEGMEVVGIAKVVKEHYPDATSDDPAWVVVDLTPYKKLKKSVPLSLIKKDDLLKNIYLVKQGRLSVMPLRSEEFDRILELSEKSLKSKV